MSDDFTEHVPEADTKRIELPKLAPKPVASCVVLVDYVGDRKAQLRHRASLGGVARGRGGNRVHAILPAKQRRPKSDEAPFIPAPLIVGGVTLFSGVNEVSAADWSDIEDQVTGAVVLESLPRDQDALASMISRTSGLGLDVIDRAEDARGQGDGKSRRHVVNEALETRRRRLAAGRA